jgi:uncharacterized protein (DUF952 family)
MSGHGEPSPRLLYHLVAEDVWAAVGDRYAPDSLGSVGFVHLSTSAQVDIPGKALYSGRDDMRLLVVDAALLEAEVVFEEGDPPTPGMLFPHLYGPLNRSAVVDVLPYRA